MSKRKAEITKQLRNERVAYLRDRIGGIEYTLYDQHAAQHLDRDQKFELSMELSIKRAELAKLLGITNPTADQALDSPEEE